MNEEQERLNAQRLHSQNWRRWGPYLSEREWGTVREDYSANGDAWNYIPHENARSRAFRWCEDGIAGVSDQLQRLCLSLVLWNGRDPILKERLFGLSNPQGNHGEDVKEIYYYLDATPTHSYLKMLYKYPQREFPYEWLVRENQSRGRDRREFELMDTGIFDDDRYYDVFVEYAKAGVDDLLIQITVCNRGPDEGQLHVLPQVWFRNTWAWDPACPKPQLHAVPGGVGIAHSTLGRYTLHAEGAPAWLFCENDSNAPRLWNQPAQAPAYYKDGFHEYLVGKNTNAINPAQVGTKAAAHYALTLPAHGEATLRLRLSAEPEAVPFEKFEEIVVQRRQEADAFYADLQAQIADPDARNVQRQAFAGMIWNKQFYHYDVEKWLDGDPAQPPPPPERLQGRNWEWRHLNNADILSMPDTWEYPWYAAWDLAFHCISLALIDAEFAKNQLILLNRVWYLHPNGQLPAYEWNFGDVNPPVQAWAAWRVFQIDRKQRGDAGDLDFLERVFHKMLLNFTWWVNRKDPSGLNIFQGGFLGLDNIGIFNRSQALPTGGFINQADGTAWMAMYCLNLLRIALELAQRDLVYEDMATKFFEHFLFIAKAMTNISNSGLGLWDEEDSFFYDVLVLPDGRKLPMRLRSMVGLIPLFAVETLEPSLLAKFPGFNRRLEWLLKNRPDLAQLVSRWYEPGLGERRLLSLLRGHRMKCLLRRLLDETEFLSDYGVRALSRIYKEHPYELHLDGCKIKVSYLPAESDSGMFGGNSNWRGPIWFPVNYLIIESLQKFHHYYGDDFKIECPTGSGHFITINDVADELTRRLNRLFLRDANGRRPVFHTCEKMQTDPHFRDYIWFHEYFHGDNGRGLGASHQTGWTGLAAKLIQPRRSCKQIEEGPA
ncbi:MAG: glucosidase [Verrucomicrobia bacterium]|nr:glucosidase [Verrucomicrobiota bacterium]